MADRSLYWPSSLQDAPDLFKGVLKFDPSQPRGPDGKWVAGGGNGPSSSTTHDVNGEGEEHAKVTELLKKIHSDPQVLHAEALNKARGSHQDDPGVLNKNGEYTPQAMAENDAIANKFLDPAAKVPIGEKPTAILTIGKPGAGKSSMLGMIKGQLPPSVTVNCDDVMPHLKGYEPIYAPAYHDRAGDIAENHLVPKLIDGHYNITFDATGRNTARMEALAENMKTLGYKVVMLHGHVDSATALERAFERFKTGGRFIPFDMIPAASKGIDTTYQVLKSKVDSWRNYELQGKTPRLTETSG